VLLNPNPITTPVPKDAIITEFKAGPRRFRASRDVGQGKQITQLVLRADPTRGPFNCDFKLGEFELKLLSVRVISNEGDTRVSARVSHPSSNRSREVYFRVTKTEEGQIEYKNRFLELKSKKSLETKQDNSVPADVYFVAVDSIALEVATGLWSKIVLSLINVSIPYLPPVNKNAQQPQQSSSQSSQSQPSNPSPNSNNSNSNSTPNPPPNTSAAKNTNTQSQSQPQTQTQTQPKSSKGQKGKTN